MAAGAALSVTDSTVNGTVTATSPAGITYCGSTQDGGLTVTGATSPVILGGTLADGTACAADTIPSAVTVTGATAPVTVTGLHQNGTLTLENDTAGVTLDGSQVNGLRLCREQHRHRSRGHHGVRQHGYRVALLHRQQPGPGRQRQHQHRQRNRV